MPHVKSREYPSKMKAVLQHATDRAKSAFVLKGPIAICDHWAPQLSSLSTSSKDTSPGVIS